MVCYDVQVEPALQPITGEKLARGTDQATDIRLDVHCRSFWERQRATFFAIRVCHPNAYSYRDLSPKQIYRIHENEKIFINLLIIIIIVILTESCALICHPSKRVDICRRHYTR